MIWSVDALADAVWEGLLQRASADDEEQVVYGFDGLDELQLHPLIQQALRQAGYGVYPEQTYPSDQGKSKRSEGKRCDVVLTHGQGSVDGQPLKLRESAVRGTLFDTEDALDPTEAFWLEIKTVAQFDREGPFTRYAAELLSPVAADVRKLWDDPLIRHAGLLLVLFTEDEPTARHDLQAWRERCLQRGIPVGSPAVRHLAINNRVGNGHCAVGCFGVRGA